MLLTVSENSRRLNPQLLRSANAGRDWQVVNSIGTDEDMVVGIDWDRNNSQRVYAGTDHGKVYCSEDNGDSWDPNTGRVGHHRGRSPGCWMMYIVLNVPPRLLIEGQARNQSGEYLDEDIFRRFDSRGS